MTYNLWQIERVAPDSVEHQVLQLVDGREEVVSEGRHGAGPKVVGDIHLGRSEAKSSMCLLGVFRSKMQYTQLLADEVEATLCKTEGVAEQDGAAKELGEAEKPEHRTAPHRTKTHNATQRNADEGSKRLLVED